MNTATTDTTGATVRDSGLLALTALPTWRSLADLTLRGGACGQLCAHGCLTPSTTHVPVRHPAP
ncbi:hypothetical protein [Streptomyces sp. NPDC048606]|uniref:hypothetical protein n=1 Tax=Streptomyces sp. NPDC048606 TaxID=3154726 RepID=UPI00342809F9